jgi:hypothetical protein
MSRLKSILISLWRFRRHLLAGILVLALFPLLATLSTLAPADPTERVRAYTRDIEFDFVGWTLEAFRLKTFQSALNTQAYLSPAARQQAVLEYLGLVAAVQETQDQISQVYADPQVQNAAAASAALRQQLASLQSQRQQSEPLAEAILQNQISQVVGEMGLTLGGQPVPPVLYHMTPLPLALIISPREVIRQDEDIPLVADLPLDQQIALETQIDQALDVSSLVVEIGGVGTYPTMVYQTRSVDVLGEIIGHEWTHNFLTLRPLGVLYLESPQMRVINETVASISGKEIGRALLEQFYPELLPPPAPSPPPQAPPPPPTEPPAFDYRKEMHATRVQTDELLSQGKIDEAEAYMEMRRQVFWQHGYRWLRKLNQAYFAFYGAYADEPGGAAGTEDPIGAAVRQLRAQSASLAEFLNRVSWVTSFDQLKALVANP